MAINKQAQLINGVWHEIPEDDNGHMTNWTFCWRCGKSINRRNSNEINQGYHNRCDTYGQAVANNNVRSERNKIILEIG